MIELTVMLEVFIIYSVMVIAVPWIICKQIFTGMDGIKRFFAAYLGGNFIIINIVYLLAFLKIYNTSTYILSYAAVFSLLLVLVKRKDIAGFRAKFHTYLDQIQLGCLKPKQMIRRMCSEWRLTRKKRERFGGFQKISLFGEAAVILLILFVITAVLSNRALTLESFAAPDEEVHLQWIQSLLNNKLFHSGIYPFGMHNVVSAIYQVTDLPVSDVLKFFGVVTNCWSFLIQYLGVRAFCRNRIAPVLGFAAVFLTNLFSSEPLLRLQLPVPHEYAITFVFIMGCFLIWFLETKEKKYVWFFATGLGLTLLTHYHATIVAGIFVVCAGIVFFIYAIRRKLAVSILVAGIAAAAAGVWPVGVGLAQGYEFEQSMAWAVSVIQGNDNLSGEEERKKEEEAETSQELGLETIPEEEEEMVYPLFSQVTLQFLTEHSYTNVAYSGLVLCMLAAGAFLHILRLIKVRFRFPDVGRLVFYLFYFVVMVMMVSKAVGLPVLLYPTRLSSYLFFGTVFILASPWEELYCLMGKIRFLKGCVLGITGGILIAGGCYVYRNKLYVNYPQHYYFQTTGASRAVSSIIRNYPKHTWTVVSVVTETAMVYRDGFHYEWIDFLDNLKDKKEFHIPTPYVFFIVEKMPIIRFGWSFDKDEELVKNRPLLKREDAAKELEPEKSRDDYYKYQREIIMAKADLWVEDFGRQYPEELTVYYEDSEVVVYRLVQNNGYNNLSIYQ